MRNFLYLTALLLTISFSGFAGEGSYVQRMSLLELMPGTEYNMLSPSWDLQEDFEYLNRVGLIHLDYTRKDHSDLDFGSEWRVWVTLKYSLDGVTYPSHQVKTVLISSEADMFKYSDYIKFDVPGEGYNVMINNIEGQYKDASNNWVFAGNPQGDIHFPLDIDFRMELREKHWYDLDVSQNDYEVSSLNFDATTYRSNWEYFEGAEQYDFEWVWIDDKSSEYALVSPGGTAPELPFELKEPSRVRVSHTHHTIDRTYAEGKLFFRVRAISKYPMALNAGIYDQVKEGEWHYLNPQGGKVSHIITGTDIFEQNKNWLYGVAYAEEGKSVSSVTFYDGSNRGRQSLTYNTTDHITLIGESKFDFEGRQTLSVVPAPVKGRSLGYRTGFNLVASDTIALSGTVPFEESDFDHLDYEVSPSLQLATEDGNDPNKELGASQYFSTKNKFEEDLFRAAIPDANGYVYSQTVYRNDGTGRIEEVGGIGETFQVGGDHSVKTYYGSTNVVELQRLFGSNVSSTPEGYRKEVVQDANGQHSVTYYDKRGNVIATALTGNSPDNLLELDDQDPVSITTPLNDNNIPVDNYTMVSEHTHFSSYPGDVITLEYDVSSIVNQISTTPITVNGATIALGDFCSTCQYDLQIEVIDQDGQQVPEAGGVYGSSIVAPYQQNIDPSADCYDGQGVNVTPTPSGINFGPISLQYELQEVGEYRIIKTLSVDQEAMQEAFDDQLEESGANDPTSFINDYISNIDISGCFDNCDDYCYWSKKFEYDQLYGAGSWAALDTLVKLDSIASCQLYACDINEMYLNEDPLTMGSNPYVSPMEQACDGYRMQMIAQISPDGVFYDTPGSNFWAEVLAEEFNGDSSPSNTITIAGNTYNYDQLQDTVLFIPEIAEDLLLHHREFCHLDDCNEWAATMDYSNALTTAMNEASWTGSTDLFTSPYLTNTPSLSTPLVDYSVGQLPYGSGDPFQYQAWNLNPPSGGFTLDAAVDDYYAYLQATSTVPVLCSPPSAGVAEFGSSNSTSSLYHYVDHLVDCIEQNNGSSSAVDYDQQRRLMLKGLYDNIKMELIAAYQEEGGCIYQTDDNSVFFGPMTQEEMEQELAGALSGITNGQTCGEIAFDRVTDWLNSLPQSCLTSLGIDLTATNPPPFTSSSLAAGSQAQTNLSDPVTTSTYLPQLMYDYVIETCPDNIAGWFFNPDEADLGNPQTADTFGEDEYIAISNILNGTCGITQVGFEVAPAPQSGGLNVTNQNFDNCLLNFIEMINDGLVLVNNYYSQGVSVPICGVIGTNLTEQIVVNATTYPELNTPSACGLNGGYQFGMCQDATTGELINLFGVDPALGGCDFIPSTITDLNGLNPFSGAGMVALSNPIRFDSLPQGGYSGEGVCFEVLYADGDIAPAGTIGSVYIYADIFPCMDLGPFEDQTITLGGFPDSLPDYESACVDATIGQAMIDAQNIYNDALNDLQNDFLASMSTCIASAEEDFKMTYTLKEYQYTLYYYDLAGNLVQTVPPQGVHPVDILYFLSGIWNNNIEPQHKMETRYEYNGLNTLIAQYTPDGGHSDFILDKLYRVRYSQNARQLDESKASYTKYDLLGRVEEAGEMYLGSGNNNLTYLKNNVEDNSFPTSLMRMDHTITYYEQGYSSDPTIATFFTDGEQKNLRNTIGAIEHNQADYSGGVPLLGSGIKTVISYSYDPHKNVKEMVSTNSHLENINQQHKTVRYEYDLISGNVNELIYQEDRSIQLIEGAGIEESYSDEYRHKYHYDANNRLVRAFTSRDGGTTWDKEAKYFYYLHGALARTELGEDEVQGTDYAYNLQGWLKGVNGSSLDASRDLGHDAYSTGDNEFFGADAHGFMLSYFDNDYQSITPTTAFADITQVKLENIHPTGGTAPSNLYNGNIHNMVTALRDFDENAMTVLSNNYQYDQLQRIRSMKVYDSQSNLTTANNFNDWQLHNQGAYQTSYKFDKNGNLKTLDRFGDDGTLKMDEFSYDYYIDNTNTTSDPIPTESNRLAYVSDVSTLDNNYGLDIDVKSGQVGTNYVYDASGQLKSDDQEGIEEIIWTVTGKVKEIKFTSASGKNDLKFVYDPMDIRVIKIECLNANRTSVKYTYYSCDAQGNVLATYKRTIGVPKTPIGEEIYEDLFYLEENMVYGSSRLGVDSRSLLLTTANIDQAYNGSPDIELAENFVWNIVSNSSYSQSHRIVGEKYYELSNHLGNVLEVISDRKVGILSNDAYVYSADVVSYSDYYPYGMLLPGRHGQEKSNGYRYSFQGQEHDDEVKGKGNSINFGARFHDPRVGRWFAVDKVVKNSLSPYQFARNNGVIYVDSDGNDELYFIIHNAGTDNVYVEAAYIKTADAGIKYLVVSGSAVGIDPQELSDKGADDHPGVIEIKPYHRKSFLPNQGSRIAQKNKLPGAFDLRVQQALDDYSYMGKLIALTGNVEAFEADINAAGAQVGAAEVIGGAAKMDASMTVTEYAGFLEGAVAIAAIGRKFLMKSLVRETTEELAEKAVTYTPNQLGKMGEKTLEKVYGGSGQKLFNTPMGRRFVDVFSKGVAHESKVGYKSLTKEISGQLEKDIYLLETGQIDEVVWTFFKNPITGKGGASKPLLDKIAEYASQGYSIRTQMSTITEETIKEVAK